MSVSSPFRRLVSGGLLVSLTLGTSLLAAGPARADEYVPWSQYLPGWTEKYIPTSENDCVAGRSRCLRGTLRELDRILTRTGRQCSHNAVFAMSYTRMTQTYGWSRDIAGFYQDVPFANHQDAVFARYYTDAFHHWRQGQREQVPDAWLIAFDAAERRTMTGTGDLLLGMSAHINRDLPFVLAGVGLVAPDGSSRKWDYDQVERWLAGAVRPMLDEAAQRFDPTLDDTGEPTGLLDSTLFQLVAGWRETAWRNAELLVSAPTARARALVAASIEKDAVLAARTIQTTAAYRAPLSSPRARATYCAEHQGDAAPTAYAFGTPRPYGL